METVFLFLLAGTLIGAIARNRAKVIRFAETAASWSIYLLLFFLGLSVGTNQTVIQNFASVGLSGILLACAAIAGSVLFTIPVYFWFFRTPPNDDPEN